MWSYLRKAFAEVGADIAVGPEPPQGDFVEFWWGNPAEWAWAGGGVKVGMALSEARSLQAEGRGHAIANLSECEFLICPSESAAIAFRESPLSRPIEVTHFGVDPDEMRLVDRKFTGKLRFLLAGAAQYRKGTDIGIQAFMEAFRWRHRTELVVWSSVKTPMRERLKEEYGHVKEIAFDDTVYDSAYEAYSKADVLLSPHLSEGFGLQTLEAMATGMPCIISRCSAPREYFTDDCGYWIEMSEDYVPVADCLDDTGGFWRLPSTDSLVDRMRYAYRHRAELKKKGENAAKLVRERYLWKHTAERICRIMEENLGESFIGNNASAQRKEAAPAVAETLEAAS